MKTDKVFSPGQKICITEVTHDEHRARKIVVEYTVLEQYSHQVFAVNSAGTHRCISNVESRENGLI